jgi:hypothetical protein
MDFTEKIGTQFMQLAIGIVKLTIGLLAESYQ